MSVLALVERLAPHIERELNLVIKSKEEAESLSSKLKKIHGGLQDAEREGVTKNDVKDWLKQIEDVAHEMEDVLDEWEILNLQVDIEGVFLDKVRSLLFYLCSCFKQVLGRRENTKKIQALSGRIDEILSEKGKFSFVSENNPSPAEFRQEHSTSIVPKLGVYGRDAVKDNLIGELMKDVGEDDPQIVSIVGIGGVGKTTLAQLVYNDVEVEGFFDLKGWVSVSEPFDALVVARSILEAVGGNCDGARNLETVVQLIRKCLQNKRFLLVLDNLWEGQNWESLKNCLDGGKGSGILAGKGSRILVTTRFESVARIMGTTTLQPLDLLSESECSEILNGIALRGRREKKECEKLRRIGVEIAKKCNGLPLAAKSLGSMLALKSSEEEWRSVLESPLWTHDDEVSDIFRVLNLSYIELSPMLKRCFLSSVMLPRGALISIDEMIRIWMAYGYLNSKANNFDQVRSKGLQYLRNLEMRSFFQKFESEEDGEGYKMHDIMHEFASHVLGDDYSFFKNGRALGSLPPASLGKLRTVYSRYISEEDRFSVGVLSLVKSVRVLSLRKCKLDLVPEQVGELVHLRLLDLSSNDMKELPETLCNLYHLQTLVIKNCEELCSLPEGIEKLVNLRHILNGGSYKLVEYPQGLEKLSGLWTLSEYRGQKLEYLGKLNQLRGSLLLKVWGSNDVAQVRKASLGNKSHILVLIFVEDGIMDDTVLEALQPPPNLQILYSYCMSGKWLSNWIGRSFENLKIVTLYSNEKFEYSDMPPFGTLPALEQLKLLLPGLKCLKTREFVGQNGFPKLKKLHVVFGIEWQEWEDINEEEAADLKAMRCLEELEINGVILLRALPRNLLQHATSLKIIKLTLMANECSLMRDIDGGRLSYLPNVKCDIEVMPLVDVLLIQGIVLGIFNFFENLAGYR